MSDEKKPKGGIAVGLLLPFTGSASATASNLERATLFAVDRVNRAGGINGVPLRVISRDTHSDVRRGVAQARQLADEGVAAVIGPESAEVAAALQPVLAERGVLFLSPLVGAAAEFGGPDGRTCDTPWFRLAPAATTLGEALAKQAQEKTKRVAIFHTTSPYDQALGTAAASRFKALGGEVVLELELDPDAQSYAAAVRSGIAAGVTDVILAASPRAAAIVVNEFDALSTKKPHWYLSPLLKTELLVQNVAPQALEGAVGIAPKILRGTGFPEAFSARWLGDQPLEGAYFYFDAVALLAFSLSKATRDGAGEPIEPAVLSAAMLDAASTGEVTSWDELDVGLSLIESGLDVYYTGLTGPVGLATFGTGSNKRTCGKRLTGQTSNWTVTDGVIVDIDE